MQDNLKEKKTKTKRRIFIMFMLIVYLRQYWILGRPNKSRAWSKEILSPFCGNKSNHTAITVIKYASHPLHAPVTSNMDTRQVAKDKLIFLCWFCWCFFVGHNTCDLNYQRILLVICILLNNLS